MTDPQHPQPPVGGGVPPVPPAPAAPAYPTPAAPPGAYQVPVGGYASPAGPYAAPPVAERRSSLPGAIALILAVLAAVGAPLVVGFAAFEIGRSFPDIVPYASDPETLRYLAPVREQVLWAELSFWAGTVLGIAAIALGIVAIVRRQGRGQGIAAVIVAALGSVVFFVVLLIAISIGAAGNVGGFTG